MSLLSLSETELRARTSMKWRTYPDDVLPLFVAEMDVLTPQPVVDAVAAAMAIGDTGYPGMALPENIMAYSVAIRGVRHTYHRMAASINR